MQFVGFDIKDMYKWALDKCALIELAILSLELIPFTSDQKYYNQKQGLYIHRCTNFSMFCRNLYSKSEKKIISIQC